MEKVIKDGKVAVCFSPNYGAGWSTWANEKHRETLLFHPAIVNMVLNKKQEEITKAWMAKNLGEEYKDVYLGGVCDLEVEWIDEGTLFKIHEYDGWESIEYYDIEDYFMA